MKFAHNYILNKDLPKYKKGWPFRWSGNQNRFYPAKASDWGYNKGQPDIYLDYEHQGYTIDEIQDKDWFIPNGELVDFIPPFPEKNKIGEYVYLTFETRLVNDVDECRAMNGLFDDKSFQDRLYDFVKKEYDRKYKL